MPEKLPAFFIAHGSPMNAIADNSFTASLRRLAKELPVPKAIMVISAHWLTQGTHVSCSSSPRLIHDFYGFPRELYSLAYPCPGAPQFAELTKRMAPVSCDDSWGIDHAAWSILRYLYPKADIPVFELSLDYNQPAEYHYRLATELSPLREQGILCIGSGNIVHNLYQADFADMDATPYQWALEFDTAVKKELLSGNHQKLVDYQKLSPHARLAVPTNEHYLPMLYTIALQEKNDTIRFIHEGIQNASVSMLSFSVGA